MFSQWRQAVESLAPIATHASKPSQDGTADMRASRSSSDSLRQSSSSSSQLADSALSNLKKTLSTQRSGSPGPGATATTSSPRPSGRTTLEERLRAKFAVGEASANTSAASSSKSSRVGTPVTDHPLSPSSTPLPDSPASSLDIKRPFSPASSLDIKRPFSPASVPLPDSPALNPTSRSHEEVVSHPLSESPAPETVEERRSTYSKEVTEEKEAETTSVEESSPSDPPEPKLEQTESTEQVEPEPEDEHVKPESQESTPPEVEHPSDPPQPSEPVEGTQTNLPTSDSASSHAVESETLGNEGPEEVADLQVQEASPDVQETPTTLPDTLQDTQTEAETVEAKIEVEAPEPVGNGHVEVQEISIPVSTPTVELSPAVDVEGLQKRLKLVEQRFADVSTSFKRLQAEKVAADRIIRELTPLETVQEADALRDYLQNMNLKNEMSQDEIKRLTGKLTRQEERIEELRDTHRLESKSQSDQIDKLKVQMDETERLLKASHARDEEMNKQKAELERLQKELDKTTGVAKEEEEKRTKAVALLKTVRQKLVKAEKDRDDAFKEVHNLKEKEKGEAERVKAEQQNLRNEIHSVNQEREIAIAGMKAQFDKEVASLKERHEKEMSAIRNQFELEIITLKATHSKELDGKNNRISGLERSVQNLSSEKNDLFDQLQLRQAELESSQSLLESLQGQTVEFQYQIREANDRVALLNEELADARQQQTHLPQESMTSTEDVSRLLSAAESKYEARISELRRHVTTVERERDEAETDWSRKLAEKIKELESLRSVLDTSAKSQEKATDNSNLLKEEIQRLQDEIRKHQLIISDLQREAGRVTEVENASQTQLAEVHAQVNALRHQYEESKAKEAQLKALNKTIREELRKVQSSAALLEKQRNPGVGYWAARSESTTDLRSPRSSVSDLPSQERSSRPGTPTAARSDEELNVEYLRNVILQFLEHAEMRPHLVRILSTILRFTPQETRRLISKV
ncbi:hypothetical protein QCA50_002031 [Cerrena zonata]|uniref:GRIP domain-containing protein n=1 Tax=Cerrena zonata TaxID=2478898 RepID=A0AAW0GML3_9APHY